MFLLNEGIDLMILWVKWIIILNIKIDDCEGNIFKGSWLL